MRHRLQVIRRLRLLLSLLIRHPFFGSGPGTSEQDILQLMDLRRSIERLDRSTLSRITCRPMQYPGPWSSRSDSPVPPELFLPGCIIPASKDIDDIIRTERAEEG